MYTNQRKIICQLKNSVGSIVAVVDVFDVSLVKKTSGGISITLKSGKTEEIMDVKIEDFWRNAENSFKNY